MRMLRLLTFLCLFLAMEAIGYSSDRRVFMPLRSDAIPTDEVSDIVQDAEGFIWIVTYKGLVRYDGFETIRYSANSTYPEAFGGQLHTITEYEGYIYIATNNGLLQMSREDGIISPVEDNSVEGLNISSFTKDSTGRLWVGGNKGLFAKAPGTSTFSAVELVPVEGKPVTDIIDLLPDSENNLWITSWERGLFRLNLQTGRIYSYTDGALNRSNVLHFDTDGNLWIGTWGNGLLHISGSELYKDSPAYIQYSHNPADKDSILDNIIYDIEEGPDGKIWIGSRSGLSILEFQGGRNVCFSNYTSGPVNTALPYNEVNSILRTKDNTMWLGMYGGGVCKTEIPVPSYKSMTLDKVRAAFKTSTVECVCRADGNTLWLGIKGHGLIRYDSEANRFTSYRELDEFKGFPNTPTVEDFLLCGNGRDLVIGTYNSGAWLYNTETRQSRIINTATFANLPSDGITSLAEEPSGNIWIGTKGGIAVLDTLLTLKEIGPYKVNDVDFDSDGNAWMATLSDGIVRMNVSDGSFSSYGTESFNTIHIDVNGRIWAGSLWNGLQVYEASHDAFIPVKTLEFLNGKQITNITEDPHGNIWVTTNNLVASVSFDGTAPASVGYFCDISDSYESSSFSINSSLYFPESDEMAFAYSRGLAIFPCSGQAGQNREQSLNFTDLLINNTSYSDMDIKEIHKSNLPLKDINHTGSFTLDRNQNDISIKFSILDFENPSSDIFHYRLRKRGEKDAGWIITNGTRNEAVFQNLKPGKYIFEVFGYKTGTTDKSSVRSISIRVLNSPWLSWYAVLGYILTILFIALTINMIRISRLKNEEKEMKKKLVFNAKDVDYTSEDEIFLQQAISVVNNNLSNEDFSQGDFAQAMAVSRDVLTYRIKNLTGYTPSAFVTNIRMTSAYNLINKKEKIKVADLAYSVGFNDPKYFSKKFKTKYGKTPKELIDEMIQNE